MPLKSGNSQAAKRFNFRELTKAMNRKGHIGTSPPPKNKEAARKQIAAIALSKAREKK